MYVGMERHGKKWTPIEIIQLIKDYESGMRWGLIARRRKRSVPTCVNRLRAVRYYYKVQEVFAVESTTLTDKKMEIKKRSIDGAKRN